jgi:hypothetical protein
MRRNRTTAVRISAELTGNDLGFQVCRQCLGGERKNTVNGATRNHGELPNRLFYVVLNSLLEKYPPGTRQPRCRMDQKSRSMLFMPFAASRIRGEASRSVNRGIDSHGWDPRVEHHDSNAPPRLGKESFPPIGARRRHPMVGRKCNPS